jgi:hypothetical protein
MVSIRPRIDCDMTNFGSERDGDGSLIVRKENGGDLLVTGNGSPTERASRDSAVRTSVDSCSIHLGSCNDLCSEWSLLMAVDGGLRNQP